MMPSAKTSERTQASWLLSEICINTFVSASATSAVAPSFRGRKAISERLKICSPNTFDIVDRILLIVSAGRRYALSSARSFASHWQPEKKSSQRLALSMKSRWPLSRRYAYRAQTSRASILLLAPIVGLLGADVRGCFVLQLGRDADSGG